MILIHLLQTLPDVAATVPNGLVLPDISVLGAMVHSPIHLSPADWAYVAQQFETDVFADFRNFFNNFIQSGQIWAMLVGVVIGYLLKSLTSYG